MATVGCHRAVNDVLARDNLEGPRFPVLPAGEIHVWHARAASSVPAQVRAHARSLVLQVLTAYSGNATITIALDARGKPHAQGEIGLDFNLSHSGADIVIAVARGQALGVDLERLDRRAVSTALIKRYFCMREHAVLAALPGETRQRAFLQLWTCKEAVLKAMGVGLSFGLDRMEFGLAADGSVLGLESIATEAGPAASWQLHLLGGSERTLGCLAWMGAPRRVREFQIAP